MIRVIEHGRIIESDYMVKCNMCGCVFQFGKSDVTNKDERVSYDEWIDHYYIRCPDCGHDIYLGDKL
jgi:uncharacterized C2H2 Zn-finger protein